MAERSTPTALGWSLLTLLLTCTPVHSASAPEAVAATSGLPPDASPPPQEPPSSLLETFTLNYTIPLEFYYVDDSNRGRGIAKLSSSHSRELPHFTFRYTLQVLLDRHTTAHSAGRGVHQACSFSGTPSSTSRHLACHLAHSTQ